MAIGTGRGQANLSQRGFVGKPLGALNSNWVKETKGRKLGNNTLKRKGDSEDVIFRKIIDNLAHDIKSEREHRGRQVHIREV